MPSIALLAAPSTCKLARHDCCGAVATLPLAGLPGWVLLDKGVYVCCCCSRSAGTLDDLLVVVVLDSVLHTTAEDPS
jgi:hypothetical protein